MKVVYNACHGGFSLSDEAVHRYADLKGMSLYPEIDPRFGFVTWWTVPEEKRDADLLDQSDWHKMSDEQRAASNSERNRCTLTPRDIARNDPALVRVVEEMGDAANGRFACLRISDVPTGTRYRIDEYDGAESVMTVEDYDWQIAS